MKLKKIITMVVCGFAAALAVAQEADGTQASATNSVVKAVLAKPDGVSILRNEKDGSLQVLARGSAAYDFGDARDIRNKTKVAELRAKAALSKYFKEVVLIEEKSSEGEARLSNSLLTETAEGTVQKKEVSRETIESVKETLVLRSAAILSGVVVRETVKTPAEGSKTSGEIQVVVGISTKTLDAATEAHNMIVDSLNARRSASGAAPKSNDGATGDRLSPEPKDKPNGGNANKPEVRVNDTIF